jgi:hypothetical protein
MIFRVADLRALPQRGVLIQIRVEPRGDPHHRAVYLDLLTPRAFPMPVRVGGMDQQVQLGLSLL